MLIRRCTGASRCWRCSTRPDRTSLSTRSTSGAIQRAARHVNDRFQREGWTPIDLRIEDNFALSVAAYKQYDVLLVNAIYDGLNLVAKEGPLVNERDGVLILSENAGAHEELGEWALSVNPFDVEAQAEAIHAAIEMAPRGAARAPSRRSATTCAPTTSAPGSRPSSRTSTAGLRAPPVVNDLSHVDADGRLRMVDVGGKEVSRRRAVARAS